MAPFSIESKRYIITAGHFLSKLRSSLTDEMIDSLCLVQSGLKN